jgi:asparagine synthase (glutamine-hydrolysing)
VPDQENIFGSRMSFSWDTIYEMLKQYFDNNLSPLDQVFLADFNGKLLQEWIPADKAYERNFNMNILSIFLSDELIELATHIPWQKKYDPTTDLGKLPLRSILVKYKGFENKLLNKKGFGTDLTNLWNNDTKEIVKSYVNLQSEIIKNNIISAEWLKKVEKKIHDPNSELKPRYINKMFLLLALEVWYRLFISKSMKSNQRI